MKVCSSESSLLLLHQRNSKKCNVIVSKYWKTAQAPLDKRTEKSVEADE